jgi:prevent-host-death family protein
MTEARNHFSELLHTVEQEGVIQLTRRNEVVAFLLSPSEYERLLRNTQTGFWNAYLAFRQRLDQTEVDLEPAEIFANVREQSVGREADW